MNQSRMPSPAILVAVLALVAALAGTAVAGPDATTSAITKKKVKKIATKQINELAPGLSVANAEHANSADNASALGGKAPDAYAASTSEPFRAVGDPGEPQFLNNWANYAGFPRLVRFYKDPVGVVHLEGTMISQVGASSDEAFRLPPGYRPSDNGVTVPSLEVPFTDPPEPAHVAVGGDGGVHGGCDPVPSCALILDGVTFRAEQ